MIRAARQRDADRIALVERLGSPSPWSADAVRDQLAAPATSGWVADLGDLVGHILVQTVAGEAEVLQITVHPGHRRQGYGRRLLGHAMGAGDISTAWLEVRVDNVAALGLYRGAGWTEARRRDAYYRDGTDALVLQWSG